jgi:drug/metabolite transporter (DMT)-like permease
MSLATGMLFFASLWLIPVVVYEHGFYAFSLPLHMRDFAIMIEIILSSLGYIIFCYLLRAAGSVYYSMVGGVVAIVGLIWGRLLFSESFTNSQWLAIVFIILSIFLLSCYRLKKNN